MSLNISLDHRVALVTGASRKLGAIIATALVRQGARVVVNYNTSAAEADALIQTMRGEGGDAVAIQGDVSDANSIARLIDKTLDMYGTLDILVNNAGPYTDTPFARLPPGVPRYRPPPRDRDRAPLQTTPVPWDPDARPPEAHSADLPGRSPA